MAKEYLSQRNWNAGELDENLLGRLDIKRYFAAAALIENCLTLPQGPLTRRPGTTFVDKVRRAFDAVAFDAGMLTAPHGGTVDKVLTADGDAMVTADDIGAGNPYVVLEIDFGAPVSVSAVDLVDIGLKDTGSGEAPAEPPFHYPWFGEGQIA